MKSTSTYSMFYSSVLRQQGRSEETIYIDEGGFHDLAEPICLPSMMHCSFTMDLVNCSFVPCTAVIFITIARFASYSASARMSSVALENAISPSTFSSILHILRATSPSCGDGNSTRLAPFLLQKHRAILSSRHQKMVMA